MLDCCELMIRGGATWPTARWGLSHTGTPTGSPCSGSLQRQPLSGTRIEKAWRGNICVARSVPWAGASRAPGVQRWAPLRSLSRCTLHFLSCGKVAQLQNLSPVPSGCIFSLAAFLLFFLHPGTLPVVHLLLPPAPRPTPCPDPTPSASQPPAPC